MATLPNLPTMPTGGAAPPSGPASMSQLVGGGAMPQPPQPSVEDMVMGVSRQVRDLIAGVDNVARQFPETGQIAEQAKLLLVEMMQQIVAAQRGPESGPAPGVIG